MKTYFYKTEIDSLDIVNKLWLPKRDNLGVWD